MAESKDKGKTLASIASKTSILDFLLGLVVGLIAGLIFAKFII